MEVIGVRAIISTHCALGLVCGFWGFLDFWEKRYSLYRDNGLSDFWIVGLLEVTLFVITGYRIFLSREIGVLSKRGAVGTLFLMVDVILQPFLC